MNKIWKFVILLGLSVSFYSCNEEVNNESIVQHLAPFSIEEAQAKYEARGCEELNLKSGNTKNTSIRIKPDWCNTITSQNDLMEVIETELLVQGSFGFADEASSTDWKETKNPKMIISLSRMVTLRNNSDGKIKQFLMTIMGDKDYHDKAIGKLSDNTYLSRDEKFSGYIFYHDLNGNFVNGWKYVNGKIVRKCSQAQSSIPMMLKKSDCVSVTVTLYNQFCTDWYQNGIYRYTSCENRVAEYSDYYFYCSFEPDPYGGDGGYGGGYENPEPVSAPVVDASDLFNNPKAACIYQKLINGGILSNFISRYFGITQQNQSYLGELNLTWTLGSSTETLPIGIPRNGTYSSVEIRLNENALNSNSASDGALSMLHEALHAKLIAEYYDRAGTTDFRTLYAYYKGYGTGQLDTNQEMEMFYDYSEKMASALQSFDQSQGINKSLDFYIEAVKYDLGREMGIDYKSGEDEFLILSQSTKNCN